MLYRVSSSFLDPIVNIERWSLRTHHHHTSTPAANLSSLVCVSSLCSTLLILACPSNRRTASSDYSSQWGAFPEDQRLPWYKPVVLAHSLQGRSDSPWRVRPGYIQHSTCRLAYHTTFRGWLLEIGKTVTGYMCTLSRSQNNSNQNQWLLFRNEQDVPIGCFPVWGHSGWPYGAAGAVDIAAVVWWIVGWVWGKTPGSRELWWIRKGSCQADQWKCKGDHGNKSFGRSSLRCAFCEDPRIRSALHSHACSSTYPFL